MVWLNRAAADTRRWFRHQSYPCFNSSALPVWLNNIFLSKSFESSLRQSNFIFTASYAIVICIDIGMTYTGMSGITTKS